MGSFSSKSTTKPAFQPQLLGAYDTTKNAFDANQGNVASTAGTFRDLGTSLLDRFRTGDPNLAPAMGYNNDVLSGRYLNNNPHLQAMIDQTGNDVANGVNAHLGTRGRTGGDIQTSLLGRELAKNETALRYQDYGDERARMGQAAGQAPSLVGAQYLPLATGMQALQTGTNMPTDAANQYAAAVGGLLGQYTNTTKQDSFFNNLMKFISSSASAASSVAGGGGG